MPDCDRDAPLELGGKFPIAHHRFIENRFVLFAVLPQNQKQLRFIDFLVFRFSPHGAVQRRCNRSCD